MPCNSMMLVYAGMAVYVHPTLTVAIAAGAQVLFMHDPESLNSLSLCAGVSIAED